ncbi:uncharacterized protein H6S33_010587 [Morchella sextelata]|uniref:uncharacterized protein n=1 Tax=Morchella sextelata TaxID=1174677 RepID=UPI001D03C1B1|nr:uncharacterized protein H6S33_010587 [Morchella sextelata]KAH0611322.1 hypothetical protein H6S33_010587 [Morchella sextelata]
MTFRICRDCLILDLFRIIYLRACGAEDVAVCAEDVAVGAEDGAEDVAEIFLARRRKSAPRRARKATVLLELSRVLVGPSLFGGAIKQPGYHPKQPRTSWSDRNTFLGNRDTFQSIHEGSPSLPYITEPGNLQRSPQAFTEAPWALHISRNQDIRKGPRKPLQMLPEHSRYLGEHSTMLLKPSLPQGCILNLKTDIWHSNTGIQKE